MVVCVTVVAEERRRMDIYIGAKRKVLMRWVGISPSEVAHADAKARKEIPSMKTTKYTPEVDNSWKIEESKKFTVAPAYNKGAYQVIPQSDIKHIGK